MIDPPLDRALLSGMLGSAGVLVLMPLLIRAAPHLGMVDDPSRDKRRGHVNPIPRVGGVAVLLVMAVALAAQSQQLAGTPWLLAGLAAGLGCVAAVTAAAGAFALAQALR